MRALRFDHLVVPVEDLDRARAFYTDVLGMWSSAHHDHHIAVHFASGALVLVERTNAPRADEQAAARIPLRISLAVAASSEAVLAALRAAGADPVKHASPSIGEEGPVTVVLVRDPDGNEIEILSAPHDDAREPAYGGHG